MRRSIAASLILVALCQPLLEAETGSRTLGLEQRLDFFEKRIRPVLVDRCYSCHSAGADSVKGGLHLDHRDGLTRGGRSGPAIVPGQPEESLLIKAIRQRGDAKAMPPSGSLPAGVIADFERWVTDGAADPRVRSAQARESTPVPETGGDFWAFQPPRRVVLGQQGRSRWPLTKIDRLVLAAMRRQGLEPVADAPAEVLARRLYFDLIGLPPSPEAIDRFEESCRRDRQRAVTDLVDHLLASPRFGERWGRHWLDVARFAESTGRSVNFPYTYAWRYRNYVIDAFNQDKPYDRFIREQLAGDLLPAASPQEANENVIATGFLAIGPRELNYDDREPAKTERYFLHSVDEQIDVTTRGFLALTVSCAQCHDHKFDPIPTTDYYALAGIFRSSETLVGYVHGLGNSGRYFPERLALLKALPGADYEACETHRSQATAAWHALKKEMTDLWTIRRQEGQIGFTDEKREKQEKVVKDHRAKLDALAKKLPPEMPVALGVVESPRPADMHVYIGGDPEKLGPRVPRGFLRVLREAEAPVIPPDTSGRRQLADWIASRRNPLTARVLANRLWHHLFGRGIVRTVDNFGATGERPSHPELLDHLAHRLMDHDWSVKRLLREIVLSRVYQLASEHRRAEQTLDPDNRFAWRASRRRLEVEALRDAMLAAAGQLDLSRPAASPLLHSGAGQIRSGKDLPPEESSPDQRHRTVYQTLIRDMEPAMLRLFDFPSTSNVHGRRDTTIVAPQALFFLNDPFVLEQSRATASRLMNRAELGRNERVELAYRTILGRRPSGREKLDANRFLASWQNDPNLASSAARKSTDTPGGAKPDDPRLEPWSRFVQTLFASAEFRYIE